MAACMADPNDFYPIAAQVIETAGAAMSETVAIGIKSRDMLLHRRGPRTTSVPCEGSWDRRGRFGTIVYLSRVEAHDDGTVINASTREQIAADLKAATKLLGVWVDVV